MAILSELDRMLLQLEPNDIDGAERVARSYKMEGGLTGDVVKVLFAAQDDPTELGRRIRQIGVDGMERGIMLSGRGPI